MRLRMRALAVLAAALAMIVLTVADAAAQKQFDVGGTVVEVRGQVLTILTSDVIGREQAILVDVSWLKDLQIQVGDPIALTIVSRESDTYLAIGIVSESPFVNGQSFGVREQFTVQQDSIEAGVGNVPSDDEALAQQHRDKNLKKRGEDDDRKRR